MYTDSVGMIENLVAHGRKLVTIVDPHIKKDSGEYRSAVTIDPGWISSGRTEKTNKILGGVLNSILSASQEKEIFFVSILEQFFTHKFVVLFT